MICHDFTESSLRALLEVIQSRACRLDAAWTQEGRPIKPIYLRFDVDDDISKAWRLSTILNEYGIRGTFFILNTAKYWNMDVDFLDETKSFFEVLTWMQDKGHEIAWHNNALTGWAGYLSANGAADTSAIRKYILYPLDILRAHGLTIRGSASHGDPLCRQLGYINYEIFKECPRTQEAIGFPRPSFDIPKVSMHDFGLEYEAYHVPYDLYLSESGGRAWNRQFTEVDISTHDRIQILIHPQHWKI